MKSIILTIGIALVASAVMAASGNLVKEVEDGMKKHCYYDNGTILTISNVAQCPIVNR